MATQAYRTWVARGRPWSKATPVAVLETWARAAGVPVLGTIGNEAHLQADTPQDHTPFPLRPWPVPLSGYIVCAIDVARGPWAERLLAAAKAGRAPYVKYLNFGKRRYDVRAGWVPVSNPDDHLHISVRSDHLYHAPTFNPFANPAPAGPAPTTVEDTMLIIAKGIPDTDRAYVGNGIFRRWIKDWDNEWQKLQSAGAIIIDGWQSAEQCWEHIGTIDVTDGLPSAGGTEINLEALASLIVAGLGDGATLDGRLTFGSR